MNKTIVVSLILSTVFFFVSCENKTGVSASAAVSQNEKEIQSDETESAGNLRAAEPAFEYIDFTFLEWKNIPLKGCFEVQKVSASLVKYELCNQNEEKKQISVTMKIKMVKEPEHKPEKWYSPAYIILLDENESEVAETGFVKLENLPSSVGEVGVLSAETGTYLANEAEQIFSKIKSARLKNLGASYKEEN